MLHNTENLLHEAKSYYDNRDYHKAIQVFGQLVQQHAPVITDPAILRKIFNLTGLTYYKLGNLEAAEKCLLQALHTAQQSGNATWLYNSHDNLAAVYITWGRMRAAMENLQKAIVLKEKANGEKDLSRGLIQLASLQVQINHTAAAKKNLTEAKKLIAEYDQPQYLMHWYFAEGTWYTQLKKAKLAIESYRKCLRYAATYQEPYIQSRAWFNMGELLQKKGQWKTAEQCYKKSIAIARLKQMKLDEAITLTRLAGIALKKNKLASCRKMLSELETHKSGYDTIQYRNSVEPIWAALYEKEGDLAAALQHTRNHFKAYEQQYRKELSQTILDMEAKYENERKEKALKEAKLLEAQSELKALRSQMNPHFIFNAISSMRYQLLQGDIEKTDQLMVRFSRLLRLILDTSRTPTMLLSENIELLHLYIQTEQTRYPDRFDYHIRVDPVLNPLSVYVPGLILQPLVENAIIHGLFHKKSGKGKLQIAFIKRKAAVEIQIADNGIGRQEAAGLKKQGHTSHATDIIADTLRLIWKKEDISRYFVTKDRVDKEGRPAGTLIKVQVPAS